jgi:hypothetical protein
MRHALPLAALLLAACQGAPLEPHGDDDGGGTIGSGTLRASNALIGSGNRTDENGSSPMGSGNDAEDDGGGAIGSGTLRDGGYLGSGNVTGGEDEDDSPLPGGSGG